MDERDIYRIIDERLALALPRDAAKRMMRISPFEALNDDGREVKVIGVTLQDEDNLEFIVIRTSDDGEMFPGLEPNLWRKIE
ncbi:hypothetical protein [Oryzifoliimicrobium ureilyticus]|uniref:hypothetical protein n=1 Tax=Oryzifoliimicrobium ureilyticus TaxID=3113724 RepID=UPI003076009C